MKTFLTLISAVFIVYTGSADAKKDKRGVEFYGQQNLNADPFNAFHGFGIPVWNPSRLVAPVWDPIISNDLVLGQVQLQAAHNLALQDSQPRTPNIAYSPEVSRAIEFAKEANRIVQLAQHRVAEAKQVAIIQQKIALAKEAAAREAAHRSAEITTRAESDARMSAQQLVALQQRLATLKEAVAAAQRHAAARENAAAAAIQRSASDTAAELHKQDVDRQISQSEREARLKALIAARDNAITHALHSSVAHKQVPAHNPWG